jgi:hypothetical protein
MHKQKFIQILGIFVLSLFPISCQGSNDNSNVEGSPVRPVTTPQTSELSPSTIAPVPFDNEDLVWIGQSCLTENEYFQRLIKLSKTADNPDMSGEELDYWDGPLALEIAKKWLNAIDEVFLALSTVGDHTLDLSSREIAHMGDFRTLAPDIVMYGYWGDYWSFSLSELQNSHEELLVYCSKLPMHN